MFCWWKRDTLKLYFNNNGKMAVVMSNYNVLLGALVMIRTSGKIHKNMCLLGEVS